MPNHITNFLIVEGKAVENVLSFIKGKDTLFDFDKIKPMPKELKNTSFPISKAVDKVKKELIEKYGAHNWYEWCLQNWGTKWNSYESSTISDNELYFLTAWSPPIRVIMELSKKFPENTFTLKYADEDIGSNVGKVTIKNEKYIHKIQPACGSKEAYEMAFKILGDDFADDFIFNKEKSTYIYKEA
jgi:hypothetical protein